MNLTILKAWLQAKFNSDETGAALVEYALLVALIAVVCIVAITFLGEGAESKFTEIGSELD